MKTKTITQELKMLKPGFGRRLIFIALFLMSFTLVKGQQSFTYSSATYCQSGSNPTPTLNVPYGYFFSSPAGLSIDFNTGTINLAASSVGAYSVTMESATDTTSIVLTITNTTPSAIFDFQNSTYCINGNNVFPFFGSGASAGIFSATPAGLTFVNVNTGEINLAASTPGTYFVTNTIPASGSCPADIDSMQIILTNTGLCLCNTFNYSHTELPGGGYDFSVSGLNPSETYTLELWDNGILLESSSVSGATSGNITHQYSHNGWVDQSFIVTNSNLESCLDSMNISITTSPCSSYTSLGVYYNGPSTGCTSDSTVIPVWLYFTNLPAYDTASFTVNWGDGVTETEEILLNGQTSGYFYRVPQHIYATPGVYTVLLTFFDASACYNDSYTVSVNVGSTTCGNLTGTVYNDANNNCTQDFGEPGMAGIEVSVTQGGSSFLAWTDASGNYSFGTLPIGTYTIQMNNLNVGYTIVCSGSLSHATTVTTGTTIENFAISCTGSFDVAITGISLMSGFYPGGADAILPHVGILNASCNLSIPGKVILILDPCIQYSTSGFGWFNNPPTTVIPAASGDTLIWVVSDINNIGTFSYWDYAVNTTTCTNAQVGDSACITMMVLPIVGDADPSNNTYTRCFEIGVSYDPNYKAVEPKGAAVQGFIPATTPNLTYTINFQNTGTAVAHNIYVLDTIDTDLTINSIEILSASHGIQAYQLENRTMKFMFANIMLPDSSSDDAHSHGFVTYRIKLNTGLAPGTQIKNAGYIYFDYNTPVVTNTTLNTIAIPSGINEIKNAGLLNVYPNPAKDKLIVSLSNSGNSIIIISDVLGKTVKEMTSNELQTQINVSDLQDGIYFIKVSQGDASYVEKIIISK